jgi:hypothetical protein
MGIFKDLRAIKQETRKISANTPRAGVRMQEMNQKMAALNASLVQTTTLSTPGPGSVAARVQVVSVTPTVGSVNGSPRVDVGVTVLVPGRPPVPAFASLMVPVTGLHRLQPGATLSAWVDPADPTAFAIDWASPG